MNEVQKDLESFVIRPYRMKRLKPYFDNMSKDNTKVLMDDHVRDVLLAQGYQTEESPRSIYSVDKLFEALSRYAPTHRPQVIMDEYFTHGVTLAYKCFARQFQGNYLEVLPLTPQTITTITSNLSGSPGLTNYGCTKAESQVRALERGLQTLRGKKAPEPCLAFKRTQFNNKTRLVWGYPYSMTAIEGLIAYPLLQKFKSGRTPMAFAMTTGALGTKLRVASYHKEWAYSIDMSQFDATISSQLIRIAFDIIATWFDPNAIEPMSGLRVVELIKLIRNYFVHTPIVMPDGKIYFGKSHGVPSGSYFTQIVDSIVNVIIAGTISKRFSLNVSKKEIFVLGDDLLMWSNRRVDLDKIAAFANQHLGVKMHGSEKSAIYHFDEKIHFLGREWDNGIPDLPINEILKRMVYPEKFRKYSEDSELRERQVKLLFLSYAAVYRSAWQIAFDVIEGRDRNTKLGGIYVDTEVYDHEGTREANPEHLSGLARYMLKYKIIGENEGFPTTTALQFWL